MRWWFGCCTKDQRPVAAIPHPVPSFSPARHQQQQQQLETDNIITLIGRAGSGKTCLVYSASMPRGEDAWLCHSRRRTMLLPALRLEVVKLSRLIVAKALASGKLVMEEQTVAVQLAIRELLRPLHAHQVDPNALLLLHESNVLHSLLLQSPNDLVLDEGFLNAPNVLLAENFPLEWWLPNADLAPTHDQVRWCMPNSSTHLSLCLEVIVPDLAAPTRVLDCSSALGFPEFAFHFPAQSCCAVAIGLHSVMQRMDVERELLAANYAEACLRGVALFGIVLTQMDAWLRHHDGSALSVRDQVVPLLLERMSQLQQQQQLTNKVPIKICLVNALDSDSARACLQELGVARSDAHFRNEFLPNGVAAHKDALLSAQFGLPIAWARSVFAVGRNWNYALLDDRSKAQVLAVHLCSKREECVLLHPLPTVLLSHILSFLLTHDG